MNFRDRNHAGQMIANMIKILNPADSIIVAIPRGGIPVAIPIAKKFQIPVKVCMTSRITFPQNPQLSVGFISRGDDYFLDSYLMDYLGISNSEVPAVLHACNEKIKDVSCVLSRWDVDVSLKDKHIFVVDDVVATGSSVFGALRYLKQFKLGSVSVVTPVISKYASDLLTERKIKYSTLKVGDESEFTPYNYYSNFEKIDSQFCMNILGKI